MLKFLFKNLLLSNYSIARSLVNKKTPSQIIPAALHTFATPFTFIAGGLYCVILGSIEFKFETFLPSFLSLALIMVPLHYYLEKKAKKAIFKWNIEHEYNALTKSQRFSKNIFAFVFFWIGFITFLFLGAKFMDGYLIK